MVDLLTAGPGLVPVWDELDFAGVIDRLLPEWAPIRLRGSSSPIHQFTIDRHSLETCVNAAGIARDVSRPDLLAVAALLHDIGKGVPGDHSVEGEPMARAIAERWGFCEADADGRSGGWSVGTCCCPTPRRDATSRTPHGHSVAETVGSAARLELLAALTAADARATSPQAWSAWRRGLVEGLVEQDVRGARRHRVDACARGLRGVAPAHPRSGGRRHGRPRHRPDRRAAARRIAADDRDGQSARGHGRAGWRPGAGRTSHPVGAHRHARRRRGVVVRGPSRPDVDAAPLRERLRPALAGDLDLAGRLDVAALEGRRGTRTCATSSGSRQPSTVLEVRAQDRRGLLWTVCRAIAEAGHSIRSAHLSTYGDEAREVFYVLGADGDRLDDEAAAAPARRSVAAALA